MRAEKTGPSFEDNIASIIHRDGFKESGKDLERIYRLSLLPPGKYYAKQVDVGLSAIGGKTHRKVDVFLINTLVFPHFIQCYEIKWQQSGGSAERKMNSAVDDAEATYKHSGYETTIIYGGPGWNPDRLVYHKKQVGVRKGLHAFWNHDEFLASVNNGCLDGEGGIIAKKPFECSEFIDVSLWGNAV